MTTNIQVVVVTVGRPPIYPRTNIIVDIVLQYGAPFTATRSSKARGGVENIRARRRFMYLSLFLLFLFLYRDTRANTLSHL
jgi:hypothetical protein